MGDSAQEFIAAVRGSRGQLDAWLEVNNEAECRAAILPLVESADQLRAELQAAHEKVKELENRCFMAEAVIAGNDALITGLQNDLAAAQATIAEMREALAAVCEGDTRAPALIEKAMFAPTNTDALHEALARECERLAGEVNEYGGAAFILRSAAAAHRARKEAK